MSGEQVRRARRAVLIALPAIAPLIVAGCSVLGSDPEPRQWYRLEDLASPGRAEGAGIARVLLVEVVATAALHEGTALVYSRAPGALAYYRFANWAEPPGRRLGLLVERRLEARGRFRAVGASTSGLRGDLLLRVGLEELVHDATLEPGVARLALNAELIDWRTRTRMARRLFTHRAPLDAASAAAAAAAFSRALTAVLDELSPWVESAAGG